MIIRLPFGRAMMTAWLAGRKEATRRVIVPQPVQIGSDGPELLWSWQRGKKPYRTSELRDPELTVAGRYGPVGALLAVTETYRMVRRRGPRDACTAVQLEFPIDGARYWVDVPEGVHEFRYRGMYTNSRFMSPWMSRSYARLVCAGRERLLDITDKAIKSEGSASREEFFCLWDKLNAGRGYPASQNPWVQVLGLKEFHRGPHPTLWMDDKCRRVNRG